LNWLNRHYIKLAPPERLHEMGRGFFQRAGLLPEKADSSVNAWADKLVDLLAPYVDKLEQLPDKAGIIFKTDPAAALAVTENAETFANDKAVAVVEDFAQRIAGDSPLTPERFKGVMNEIKTAVGVKGKDLFHPVRIALIGSHSGPDFDKLVPLIEEGSRLKLPVHVKSVLERAREFAAALSAAKSHHG
jgi:glutamyl-tRNA synthetase/nondiscriminating glutamyl-tRNA synthetase